MTLKLNKTDYTKILKYYKLPIPSNKKTLKKKAEQVLSDKLCSCIKKVSSTNEPKSIRVCTRSVINTKGLKRGKFTCKRKRSIQLAIPLAVGRK